ncbi:hypothetical protein A1Q1_02597 [Trichosporon asahii var. asahii CBS 2479]|uniref:Uncharacterized protein n=1 Tax=Trichosporon asahii var. asahii (strain ATCC 90039 / CBS 2479 / JCM 2466 / KCTC 7840 / NBRC 103889/ NCYC 2677 / UAMH 7654) TaxID=1186058 RepID=J6EUN5_TRIAS|nr:hypothetical protein A1Q1_02597 [Trichosporon asahii var. asahii CBS 2479]EJT48314.1 hypothetical protein A1Q1_02597 [Trichosporon asahii var. asahii CBS 2479]
MPPKGSPAGRTDAVTIALVLQPGAEVIFGPLIELNLICKLGPDPRVPTHNPSPALVIRLSAPPGPT